MVPTFLNSSWQISFARWSLAIFIFFQFPPYFFLLIGLRSGLFAGHVIELICLSWWKAKTLCSARCIIILKNGIIITKLLSIYGMRKFQCVDCWGMDCHFPWSWHATPKWVEEFDCFLQAVIFIHYTFQVPASSPCPMQICDSSLNIAFIQSSTLHDFFSLAHCNLVFFCLGVNAGFR